MAMATVPDTGGDTRQEQDEAFRLLDLPPELWVKIGKMASDDATKSIRDWTLKEARLHGTYGARPWVLNGTIEQEKQLAQPSITKVCRVLREELLPYHYAANVALAVFNKHGPWVRQRIDRWLKAIGTASRTKIQHAYIIFDGGSYWPNCPGPYENVETLRATYFTDQVPVDLGPPLPFSETTREFQQYYDLFMPVKPRKPVVRKITFR